MTGLSHEPHTALPGYHPDQIFHDGCGLCEARGADVQLALEYLDQPSMDRAWRRAAEWQASSAYGFRRPENIAQAEVPLLRALWAIEVHLERRGVPLGTIPVPSDPLAAERWGR
jgi:hypothetical protein